MPEQRAADATRTTLVTQHGAGRTCEVYLAVLETLDMFH